MEQNTPVSPSPDVSGGGKATAWVIAIIIIIIIIGAFAWNRSKNRTSTEDQEYNEYNQSQNLPAASNPNQAQPETPAPQPATSTASSSPAASSTPNAQVQTFTVEGGEFYYKPNLITVNKGDKVKIIFNNVNGFHDFVLDEFSVKTPQIQGGKSATVEFTADKTGSFEFYCSVGQHRQMGMKGTLVVK